MIAVHTGGEPVRRRKKPKVFLSYRRADSSDVTGRLYDRLIEAHGARRVIHDVHSIAPGEDFRNFIENEIPTCTVMLAIIGPEWMPARGKAAKGKSTKGRPALRGGKAVKTGNTGNIGRTAEDYVRLEIACALAHGVRIVPVLVRGAKMPTAQSLPKELRGLLRRNTIRLRGDPDFHRDVDRLLEHIR